MLVVWACGFQNGDFRIDLCVKRIKTDQKPCGQQHAIASALFRLSEPYCLCCCGL